MNISLFSLIQRLLSEILSNIFQLTLSAEEWRKMFHHPPLFLQSWEPAKLRLVCKLWNSAIISTPKCWTGIPVVIDEAHYPHLQAIIRRTGPSLGKVKAPHRTGAS